jgi:hypothetical protein
MSKIAIPSPTLWDYNSTDRQPRNSDYITSLAQERCKPESNIFPPSIYIYIIRTQSGTPEHITTLYQQGIATHKSWFMRVWDTPPPFKQIASPQDSPWRAFQSSRLMGSTSAYQLQGLGTGTLPEPKLGRCSWTGSNWSCSSCWTLLWSPVLLGGAVVSYEKQNKVRC